MNKNVPLRTLPPGTRFRVPTVEGTVIRHGPGSTQVALDRSKVREFTPLTGRNAGQMVRIVNGREYTTWSLETRVEVVDAAENVDF